jgi:hypothetical protein
LPTLAKYEEAGIPSGFIIFQDQDECWKQACKLNGIATIRRVYESRTVPGHIDVERIIHPLMRTLTDPLTKEEKKSGRWELPDPRILFEGTLEDAQEFYQQTEIIPTLQNAPFALYTDGLPVIVPTEERVERMLKGTSHKPEELIVFHENHRMGDRVNQMGNSGIKGNPVHYMPMRRTATVEKVATIAVMAGCKPEYLPIVLTMAEAGGGEGRGAGSYCVSGPIAREIGMNFDVNVFGPGNPANRSLGRASELIWRNFGGEIPSVNNCGVFGTALTNCFPENAEALPPGWKGLNEEYDFKKTDNVLVPVASNGGGSNTGAFMPGGYRELQKSGHGGIARRLGVKGIPGPHNILDYVQSFWTDQEGGFTFVLLPEIAQHLYEYGFKSKDAVYEYMYKRSFMTLKEYRTHQRPDINTNAWKGVERISGKPWKELPDDYMIPAMNDPYECCIIVTGAGEEVLYWMGGRGGLGDNAYSIDAWR